MTDVERVRDLEQKQGPGTPVTVEMALLSRLASRVKTVVRDWKCVKTLVQATISASQNT